ncbi:MAG: hypothetical protein IPI49_21930 [Myxococcales bacterium]|nr:hypothetical protein [Myxococcales bacterium]
MLSLDTLVTDLIFAGNAALDQKTLLAGLGGEEALTGQKLLDVDSLDPRAEMELFPSMPFRHRNEKRLIFIADEAGPMRANPGPEELVPVDLRHAKDWLVTMCTNLPVRLGRLFAMGSWGDAVLVARSARDLRGIALLPWVLDPQTDVDGKKRASQLSQKEFETKLMAYEKRLEELDDEEILAGLQGVNVERRGPLIILDVLEADGTWMPTRSLEMEAQLAAMERFSILPGAPAAKRVKPPAAAAGPAGGKPAAPPAPAAPEPPAPPKGPPLRTAECEGKVVLIFPPERFDLDVAAALGKRDWDHVVTKHDAVPGAIRDRIHRDGAMWIAPLEFLSEVFIDGKPLTKADFLRDGQMVSDAVRALEVHFPRFGPVVLFEVTGKGRFVSSLLDRAAQAAQLVAS